MRDWKFVLLNTWPPRFFFGVVAALLVRLFQAARGDRPFQFEEFTSLPILVVLAFCVAAMLSNPVAPTSTRAGLERLLQSRAGGRRYRPRLRLLVGAVVFASFYAAVGLVDGTLAFGTAEEVTSAAIRLALALAAGAAVTWLFVPLPERPSSDTHRPGDQSPTS